MASNFAYLTPPEIAKQLRVSPDRVAGWIRSGQLPAVNVGDGPLRPRWRIAVDDFELFLARRSAQPPPKVVRRRRAPSGVIRFFK